MFRDFSTKKPSIWAAHPRTYSILWTIPGFNPLSHFASMDRTFVKSKTSKSIDAWCTRHWLKWLRHDSISYATILLITPSFHCWRHHPFADARFDSLGKIAHYFRTGSKAVPQAFTDDVKLYNLRDFSLKPPTYTPCTKCMPCIPRVKCLWQF